MSTIILIFVIGPLLIVHWINSISFMNCTFLYSPPISSKICLAWTGKVMPNIDKCPTYK